MTTIDERVVSMKFDNAQFERGVQTSMGSLNNLNKSLQLQGATKGLDNLTAAAKNVKLDHISNAVDAIGQKFSAMGAVAFSVINNIVSQAMFAGQQFVKSLTIDPIKQGLAEYEDKLTSIKTILANTARFGTDLNEVTGALNELNEYSDKTIYSFAEMTRSVKMFTTAGVDLDTSTASIKGLSNVAALTGTNATDAARAMYQMSLALSSGSVRLQDWISMESAGGMAGKVFQDSLIQTAKVHGVNVEAMIKKNGSFRNSLQEGWLTTEVLTETLSKFTGDLSDQQLKALGYTKEQIVEIQKLAKSALSSAQDVKTMTALFSTLKESAGSGWAQTWEILFGNVDEATKLWSGLNKVIGGALTANADARNKLLGEWKDKGGREALLEGFKNTFEALTALVKPIREAFREIFPATTVQDLLTLTYRFRNFTEGLKIGGETADRIKRIFAGFFAILSLGWDVIKGVVGVLFDLIGGAAKGSGGFLEFVARIADWVVEMRTAIKEGKGLEKFFENLKDVITAPLSLLKRFGNFLKGLWDGFDTKGAGAGFSQFFSDMLSDLEGFGGKVGEFFGNLGELIKKGLSNITWDDVLNTIMAGFGLAATGTLGLIIQKIVGGFGGGGGPLGKISETFDQLKESLGSLQNTLRATTLLQIAAAIAVLTISVVALSKIDSEGLTRALSAITVMMGQLGTSLFLMEKYLKFDDIAKMYAIAGAMVVLGIAVNILASAVKKLAELSWDELARGLFGVTILIGALVVAVQNMPNDKKMISSAIGLVILAGAIKLLTSSVEDFSEMSWPDIAKGLTGVGALLLALGLFTRFSNVDKSGMSSGLGLLLLAGGIFILASALEKFTNMSWPEIASSLVTMGIALNLITVTLRALPASSLAAAGSVLLVAFSMTKIAEALQTMGKMSWGEIGKALTTMLGAFTIIAAALYVIPPTAPLGAAAVLIVAMSLAQIGDFLQRMGELDWDAIGKAMTVLAGSLFIIGAAMLLMIPALPGALALHVVVGALTVLLPVLQALGAMTWEEILKGLVGLAGAFLVIGVSAMVLAVAIPFIFLLGASIFLLGAAVLAAGVGVLAFSAGLTLLAALGTVAIERIKTVILSLVGLIPQVMAKLAEGILSFAEVIAKGGPAITRAITTVLLSIITAIDTVAPKIINTLFKLLTLMLAKLMDFVPKMVRAGLTILLGVLSGIADNIYKIVTVAVRIVTEFIRGIGDNIGKITKAAADLIIKFVNALADTIEDKSEEMGKAGGRLASAIIKGMVKGLGSGASEVASAARSAAKAALDAAKNFLGINSPSKEFMYVGEGTNEGFALGINKSTGLVTKATKGVGATALDTLRKSLSGMSDIWSSDPDMNPTITPVLDLSEVRKDAGKIGGWLSAKPISVGSAYFTAHDAASKWQANRDAQMENASLANHTESVTYNQYNNSPKALSSAEIYRQTKNQLSVTKGALTQSNAY